MYGQFLMYITKYIFVTYQSYITVTTVEIHFSKGSEKYMILTVISLAVLCCNEDLRKVHSKLGSNISRSSFLW